MNRVCIWGIRRAATIAVVALGVTAAPAAAGEPTPPPWLEVENGQTQPQFALADAIEETVFVETKLDSDGDGRRDRVRIRISRPRETETMGYKVPVVFEHSPYRGDLGPAVNHEVDFQFLPQESAGDRATRLPGSSESARSKRTSERSARTRMRVAAGPCADLPAQLDNYYVPRGYAVVLGESIGTFNSDGCPTVGDRVETLGTKAVIDWLNGRARAFDADGQRVSAGWTTGAVGMVGVSYNGTLPNQVATTGVEGLRDDRPDLGHLQLVRLLPRQRPRRRPPLRDPGRGRERLPRRGHRRAGLLHRRQPDGRPPAAVTDTLSTLIGSQDRVTGD